MKTTLSPLHRGCRHWGRVLALRRGRSVGRTTIRPLHRSSCFWGDLDWIHHLRKEFANFSNCSRAATFTLQLGQPPSAPPVPAAPAPLPGLTSSEWSVVLVSCGEGEYIVRGWCSYYCGGTDHCCPAIGASPGPRKWSHVTQREN